MLFVTIERRSGHRNAPTLPVGTVSKAAQPVKVATYKSLTGLPIGAFPGLSEA
jgi:hypothetical protein